VRHRHRLILLAFCAAAAGACNSDDDPMPAAPRDAAGPMCLHPMPSSLPAPSDACLAGCGNELGVGQPCSKNAGECSELGIGNAIFCTADVDDGDLKFCTRPCVKDEQCGTNARCAVDPVNPGRGSGCFPKSCDTSSTAPDAGVAD
jgi:hypothetical protein